MASRNVILIMVAATIAMACHSITAKQRFSNLFAEAISKINEFSLQPVADRTLFESAMRGMLDTLDENSTYLTGDDYLAMEQRLHQEFGGVGMFVDINPRTKQLTVISPVPNSPAFNSGIRSGDIIAEINGTSTTGLDRAEAIRRMRGPVGEKVMLTVLRSESDAARQIELIRQMIPTPSVVGDVRNEDGTWNYFLPEDSRIAYINIVEFSDRTAEELAELLREISPQLKGLILDLRTNGGGLLAQAVQVCDLFLGNDEKIVEIRGRGNHLTEPPRVADPSIALSSDIPIVVLVDRFTASASEIVAACLQDHRRAIVIGERSFGKGTVQELIPLERGRSSIKITTATYWRPSGMNIDRTIDKTSQQWGVQPDPGFQVTLSEDELYQVIMLRNRRQYKLLDIFDRSSTNGPPSGQDSKPADKSPDASEPLVNDPGLQRAIEHLRRVLDGETTT